MNGKKDGKLQVDRRKFDRNTELATTHIFMFRRTDFTKKNKFVKSGSTHTISVDLLACSIKKLNDSRI